VGGSATFRLFVAGVLRVGAGRGVPVVKLKIVDHAAVPLLDEGSMACTCQKYVPAAKGLGGV